MHQHRWISLVGSIGHQQLNDRTVSLIDRFKIKFFLIQTNGTDGIRMRKGIVLGIGCHLSVKVQINGQRSCIAIHTHVFIEMPDGFRIEHHRNLSFSSGRYRFFCPLCLGTSTGSRHIGNNQRLVSRIGKLISHGCRSAPQHVAQVLSSHIKGYFRLSP